MLLGPGRRFLNGFKDRTRYLSPSLDTFKAFEVPLTLVRGRGQYLWDDEGNKYLDLFGHNMTISIGHADERINEKVIRQLRTLPHCSTVFHNPVPEKLAQKLIETFPKHPSGEDWVAHFVNSGSEAVDLAIRMAQAHTQSYQITSLKHSYHGLQGLAADATYVTRVVEEDDFVCTSSENNIPNCDTIIFEPVQGYGGVLPLTQEFVNILRQNCEVLIADEVQTGMGRTGLGMWGFCRFGPRNVPDIVVCAKGLGNGVGIIAGVVARRDIAESFAQQTFFNTYGCNPVACTAALEVLRIIEDVGLIESNYRKGEMFKGGLKELKELESVNIRGDGLMLGMEIADSEKAEKLQLDLLNKHNIIVGRGGRGKNVIRIQPPFCISDNDVWRAVESIRDSHISIMSSK